MEKIQKVFYGLVLFMAILVLFSCNPIENITESNTMIIFENLTGTDMEGNTVNFLESDVLTVDPDTGAQMIISNAAAATLKATLLDPQPINPTSEYNNIQLTRYTVSYFRSDGKNSEGVDIPYSFEGYLSTRLAIDVSTKISFIIVRAVAKGEPPLLSLREGRSEGMLTITARVDFYGHDLRDKTVTATGYLTIYFANFAE
jgi:hypothetical protein